MSDPFKGLPVSLGLSTPPKEERKELPLAMRHLPQRAHDQEKLYSPPLRTLTGGYGYDHEARLKAEQERVEYCKRHERQYNDLMNLYINRSDLVKEGSAIEGFNEAVRALNDYYGSKGCPSLPEIETPTFATKR